MVNRLSVPGFFMSIWKEVNDMDDPPNRRIFQFDSLEQAFAMMDEAEEEANQHVLPEQRAITWGDYAVRVWSSPQVGTPPVMIFGQISTKPDLILGNLESGGNVDEAYEELRVLEGTHARGYRYGRWFSIIEPRGEYGEAHIADLWPLRAEEFVRAKANQWAFDTQVAHRMVVEVRIAAEAQARRDAGNGGG